MFFLQTIMMLAVIFIPILGCFYLIRFLNRKNADKAAEGVPTEVRRTLSTTPPHRLSVEEKKQYRGKAGIYGIVAYVFVLVIFIIVGFVDEHRLLIKDVLLISIPFGVVILALSIRDMTRMSSGKNIYRIRAFCSQRIYGKNASYTFVYYNFSDGRMEGVNVASTMALNKKDIVAGQFCEILVIPKSDSLKFVEVA